VAVWTRDRRLGAEVLEHVASRRSQTANFVSNETRWEAPMRVDLNARVLTRDGEGVGKVEHAIIEPQTNEVTDFIVNTGGLVAKNVVVPHDQVDDASTSGDVLRLRIDRLDVERLPSYEPANYGPPPPEWLPPTGLGFPYASYLWPMAQTERQDVAATAREPWEAPRRAMIDKGSAGLDRDGNEVGLVENVRLVPGSDQLEGLDIRLGGPLRTLFPGGDVVSLSADLIDSIELIEVKLRIGKESLASYRRS